jgi:hypothetical protein
MVSGRQVQPLLPSTSTVPSASWIVASALISGGAAERAWAILSSALSPAQANDRDVNNATVANNLLAYMKFFPFSDPYRVVHTAHPA